MVDDAVYNRLILRRQGHILCGHAKPIIVYGHIAAIVEVIARICAVVTKRDVCTLGIIAGSAIRESRIRVGRNAAFCGDRIDAAYCDRHLEIIHANTSNISCRVEDTVCNGSSRLCDSTAYCPFICCRKRGIDHDTVLNITARTTHDSTGVPGV